MHFKVKGTMCNLGRGVVATETKQPGEFVLEYAGRALTLEEGEKLEAACSTGYRMIIANKYW
jgi:hypothetical protein